MEPVKLSTQEIRRYNKQILLPEIGLEGQEKLKNSRVLVIGAGGIGSSVLQYIATGGIGKIGIVDDDLVDQTNMQRQIMYGANDLEKLKTIVARDRLHHINPLINIEVINLRLKESNAEKLCKDFDILIDATNNKTSQIIIDNISIKTQKPWVYGFYNEYIGGISVFNYKSRNLYTSLTTHSITSEQLRVEENGVLCILPGIIGALQANEIFKLVTGFGDILDGKLLEFDIRSSSFSLKIL